MQNKKVGEKMENITLGQLSQWLTFILVFGGSIVSLLVGIKKILNKQLEPIYKKIDKIDENQCRNFLVDFLADVEKGIEKDDVQVKRAYEVYEHYTKDLHKNSYIHDKWEKLMK